MNQRLALSEISLRLELLGRKVALLTSSGLDDPPGELMEISGALLATAHQLDVFLTREDHS